MTLDYLWAALLAGGLTRHPAGGGSAAGVLTGPAPSCSMKDVLFTSIYVCEDSLNKEMLSEPYSEGLQRPLCTFKYKYLILCVRPVISWKGPLPVPSVESPAGDTVLLWQDGGVRFCCTSNSLSVCYQNLLGTESAA